MVKAECVNALPCWIEKGYRAFFKCLLFSLLGFCIWAYKQQYYDFTPEKLLISLSTKASQNLQNSKIKLIWTAPEWKDAIENDKSCLVQIGWECYLIIRNFPDWKVCFWRFLILTGPDRTRDLNACCICIVPACL